MNEGKNKIVLTPSPLRGEGWGEGDERREPVKKDLGQAIS